MQQLTPYIKEHPSRLLSMPMALFVIQSNSIAVSEGTFMQRDKGEGSGWP